MAHEASQDRPAAVLLGHQLRSQRADCQLRLADCGLETEQGQHSLCGPAWLPGTMSSASETEILRLSTSVDSLLRRE